MGSEGNVSQDPVFPICTEFPAKRPLRTAFSPQLAPAAEFLLEEERAGDKKTEWLLPPLLAARLDGRKGPQQGRGQKNGFSVLWFLQENFPRAVRQTDNRNTVWGRVSSMFYLQSYLQVCRTQGRPGLQWPQWTSTYDGWQAQQDGRRTRPLSHRSSILGVSGTLDDRHLWPHHPFN